MGKPVNFGSNIGDDDDDDVGLPQIGTLVREVRPSDKPAPNQLAQYKKRVWIILEDNESIPPTGLFIGHNGVGFMLKAGVPAEVPVELLEILNHAEYNAPVVDPSTKQIIEYRPRLRFSYRRVAPPTEQVA